MDFPKLSNEVSSSLDSSPYPTNRGPGYGSKSIAGTLFIMRPSAGRIFLESGPVRQRTKGRMKTLKKGKSRKNESRGDK